METDFRIQVHSLHGAEPDLVISTKLSRQDVLALRFSPDGTRVVCETRDGQTVEWDARTGVKLACAKRLSWAA
jgi:WD40 repeat protein